MLTAEKLEVGLRAETQKAADIQTQGIVNPTWRQDPLLLAGYREFESLFKGSETGNKSFTPIRIPSFYVTLAIRLAEEWGKEWGKEDRHQYEIGLDTQGRTDFAYGLYRNRGEEHIATVFPHAYRNDQIVMVHSLAQASDFFQLLFEAKLREEESWKRVAPEDIYALEPQRHGIV